MQDPAAAIRWTEEKLREKQRCLRGFETEFRQVRLLMISAAHVVPKVPWVQHHLKQRGLCLCIAVICCGSMMKLCCNLLGTSILSRLLWPEV